ncbi:hypothetical protein HID58_064508 [Brassica napus]|uniref:Neprosin PEP catalytic domain-containing protein n=1 Tax=Brassica napus TaxID=3708 RepID=A0ABQ7ZA67_BRANA|nr:hypothetical protein HID58_064508 [Brassica napus]
MMKAEEEGGFGWQVWHRNGTACPHGSFPIRRVEAEAELSEGKYGDDFSLAQIWVTSGSYENQDLNTLETGWQVYPNKYGDHQPRLFTYWTVSFLLFFFAF